MNPMTIDEYVAAEGNTCPKCRKEALLLADECMFDGAQAWRKIVCTICAAEWNETFVLSGYEFL